MIVAEELSDCLMYGTSSDLVKCTSHKLKVGFGHIPHSVLSFLAVNLPLTLAIIAHNWPVIPRVIYGFDLGSLFKEVGQTDVCKSC